MKSETVVTETNYTVDENQRNRDNAELFTEMLKVAFPDRNIHVMSSHHICFMLDCNFHTIDEIPSADALIFDHEIMSRIFGKNRAIRLMQYLAALPAVIHDYDGIQYPREKALKREFSLLRLRADVVTTQSTAEFISSFGQPLTIADT